MEYNKAQNLIVKLFENRLTAKETLWLSEWLEQEKHLEYFNKYVELNHLVHAQKNYDYQQSLNESLEKIRKRKQKMRRQRWLKYAAIFVICIGVGFVLFKQQGGTLPDETSFSDTENNINPGSEKAVLTLNNGKNIALHKGKTYSNQSARSGGKRLIYRSQNPEKPDTTTTYNSLTVPRGGQFTLSLPDSTKIWLNSASKIKYPIHFIPGQPREVELVYGEAYFEVSPSANHHGDEFKVAVGKMEAQVLGTEFNIKAYEEEMDITTTLVNGRVVLKNDTHKTVLTPYQQAVLPEDSKEFEVNKVSDFNQTLWKEGLFSFQNKSLESIMKVLSRWYDMDVVFESSDLKRVEFTGKLDKKQPIEGIMKTMCQTENMEYSINDQTLTLK